MKKVSKTKGILIFYGIDLLLLLFLIIAFLPFSRKTEEPSRKTALLNPNAVETIAAITLSVPDGTDAGWRTMVTLTKKGTLWTGSSSESSGTYIWPCNPRTVQSLVTDASRITEIATKATSAAKWKNFGVDDKHASIISFYNAAGGTLSQLFFGAEDPLTQRLYFRTWTDQSVFETQDNTLQQFLTADESYWADPYIVPVLLSDEEGLRRGKLENIAPRDGLQPDYSLKKECGNGARALFKIYKKDDSYIVIPTFVASPAFAQKDAEAIAAINYRYSISGWTLERLIEETKN